MITSRALRLAVFAVMLGTVSCSKRDVAFQEGGVLSIAERQSMAERIGPYFASWRPDYSAQWNDKGIQRHVCLRDHDAITSIVEAYQVLVFDGAGHVVEANEIEISNENSGPKSLISVSPLRVEFGFPDGSRHRAGFAHSVQEGVRLLKQYGQQSKALLDKVGRSFP